MINENDGFSRITKFIEALPSFIKEKTNVGECMAFLAFITEKQNIDNIDEAIESLRSGKVKIHSTNNLKNLHKYEFIECYLVVYVEF
jgi:hypothetical protein